MPGAVGVTSKTWKRSSDQLQLSRSPENQARYNQTPAQYLKHHGIAQPRAASTLLEDSYWNLESILEIMTIINSWKLHLTCAHARIEMKCQGNGHLVTHECGSNLSQRIWHAGRVGIPELGQIPGSSGIAHSKPKGQDPGGFRCSVWHQCQS